VVLTRAFRCWVDIGYRLPNAVQLFRKVGVNILLVDYRGFGHSEGEPSEDGIKLDAEVRDWTCP
jgi:alpha/beta superfamily hydrolase